MATLNETGMAPGLSVLDDLMPAPSGRSDQQQGLDWWPVVRLRLMGCDLVAVTVALAVAQTAVGLRLDLEIPRSWAVGFAVAAGVLWLLAIAGAGGYQIRHLGVGAEEYRRICTATFRAFAVLALLGYATHLVLPRSFIVLAAPLGTLLLLAGRWTLRRSVVRARDDGRCLHRVLVVGGRAESAQLVDRLKQEPAAGFRPVAVCLPPGRPAAGGARTGPPVHGVPVLGIPAEAAAVAAAVQADVVAVAPGPSIGAAAVRDLAWSLEGSGVDLVVSPTLTDVAGPRIEMRPVSGLPLLYVDEPRLPAGRHLVKTVIDFVGAGVGLLLLAPFLLVIALAIRLSSPGPALFRQARIGRGGQTFQVLKFRTMYCDAEARLGELRNDADGLLFKVRDDPRITPFGRWLRRTSIDELPQLGNVLLGQMSLVGPRPLPVRDCDVIGHARRRLLVRPGITGLWQVSGRSDVTWEEAVRLDLNYVENWSVSLDLLILLRTVNVVLRRRGAY